MNNKVNGPIHALRVKNYKVRVTHMRHILDRNVPSIGVMRVTKSDKKKRIINGEEISPKGGKTVIEITTPRGGNYNGIAVCSLQDSFDRRLGIKICLNRIAKIAEKHNKTLHKLITSNT